jgi:BirA family biotin operon repressor/biotin-[acetyl-CoA-carboxylase] ligase
VDDVRRALLGADGVVSELRVVEETGSTNANVRAAAMAGAPEGVVVVAEHQTAGRGRLDRRWVAPARSGLTFSILLRPVTVPARRWPWLPLLAGCAVLDGLTAVAGVTARLKWPNDVLVDERKLGGILLERVETPTGPAAVVGIGLNVTMTADELAATRSAAESAVAATSLLLAGARTTDRASLLVALIRALQTRYQAWRAVGGDPDAGECGGLRADYRAVCATLGRDVRVQLAPDRWLSGRARDIDADGRLVVRTSTGDQVLGAGDVTHVRWLPRVPTDAPVGRG